MPRIKKIYKYVNRMVRRCAWCEGTGYSVYLRQTCTICKGTGGTWKRIRELVGEEVIE
jgi:predicted nucleic acid binding AN1-type Zn finger protein